MKIIVLLGPTASGKTTLATRLADDICGEIISADSRQVYKGMDLGTGKDLGEYVVGENPIPYHLIDIVNAGELYNINLFYKDFVEVLDTIKSKGSTPILCGGSGLYLKTAIEGNELASIPINKNLRDQLYEQSSEILKLKYDSLPQKLRDHTDDSTMKRMIRAIEIGEYLNDNPWPEDRRPNLDARIFGLNPSVKIRRRRISDRLRTRIEEGMIEEVNSLLVSGISPDRLIFYGLEYKWITLHLQGRLSRDEMITKLETEIHRFAKRQMTYFRSLEKAGWKIHWLDDTTSLEEKIETIKLLSEL